MMNTQLTQAKIVSITPLTDSILQLILSPDTYIEYQAGQYLQIIHGEEPLSYSIANAPLGSHQYELHIRHSRDSANSVGLLKDIKSKSSVSIRLPLGECHLNRLDANKPILFIAGGTGFAPIKAMIEQLLAEGSPRVFELYWSARSKSDLYMDEKVSHWQAHVAHFDYVSLLSETGKTNMSTAILKRHAKTIKDWQIVISGPFDMVYAIRDELVAAGVNTNHLFSDAFSFEGKT